MNKWKPWHVIYADSRAAHRTEFAGGMAHGIFSAQAVWAYRAATATTIVLYRMMQPRD